MPFSRRSVVTPALFQNEKPHGTEVHAMHLRKILTTGAIAAAFVVGLGFHPAIDTAPETGTVSLTLAHETAAAQTYHAQTRRVARRTARRTSRRQAYLRSLPAGCALRGAYHYCGGVYYQPVVQSGTTVYVVVTP